MGDNWIIPFIETVAAQDDPLATAGDFLFDPYKFAETASDAEFLRVINETKEKADFQVVFTLRQLFVVSPTLVINDDEHILFVVNPLNVRTLQFLLNQRASVQWVEVTLTKPRTREMLMKYQFTNVRIKEVDQFMWYKVFQADYDRLHVMVQNVSEI